MSKNEVSKSEVSRLKAIKSQVIADANATLAEMKVPQQVSSELDMINLYCELRTTAAVIKYCFEELQNARLNEEME